MKKWFEKWSAEKAKRKEKNLPAIVEYRDETYVSVSSLLCVFEAHQQW
jgi:DNA cross-link repair 1A protein